MMMAQEENTEKLKETRQNSQVVCIHVTLADILHPSNSTHNQILLSAQLI